VYSNEYLTSLQLARLCIQDISDIQDVLPIGKVLAMGNESCIINESVSGNHLYHGNIHLRSLVYPYSKVNLLTKFPVILI
jgi:hypothetical protein